ncbi:metalloendopeptidase-like membrane protein [Leptolyngbya sp. Heron Island J]|uniref:peptidoglycan DD-metalloendopeptidase family protein n=1 Tax=Leptolyngbya sp. Heron Island J TaxID=1385935 RepID=UPI0003B9D6AB|nr:peptidoglycan DD-metalloendopeptidase family protein [Leptolyngbya sp. Heron Island J]ESA32515.1 metalloendopeptidase-like membrane protein [Leptolyngbya sp. Heron Island J]
MTAADNKLIQTTRKSLLQGSRLLTLSLFAMVGGLSAGAVMAQTEAGAIDLVIPESTPEAPAAQSLPVAPEVIVPVTPSNVVPSAIESSPAGPDAVDYGTVFIEQNQPSAPTLETLLEDSQPADQTPAVELISPADYSTGLIDPTDYGVGATLPEVVISERSSGCEFAVQTDNQLANAACRQVNLLASAIAGNQSQSAISVPTINIPGLQMPGATTAASRDYYNRAAQPVVQLQLGEKFIFPLTTPATISSLFGWRIHPIFGVRRFHSGTDIAAPLGTSVIATQAGRVSLSEYLGGYGLTVILRHNDNTLESRYAHLSRLLVQPGEWVEQGEVIGLVGSTGNSTGPHLHFELRQLTSSGWIVLNPDSLLKQTLGSLAQVLGNSLVAFTPSTVVAPGSGDALTDLPFRPAQPHAN